MIFEVQSYSFILQDRIYALAIGFVTGFVNQLLAVFLYRGKWKIFTRDILVSLFFTVAIFSYSVSFANYKILRWYNVAFALMGAVFFTPCFSTAGNLLVSLAGVTVRHGIRKTAATAGEKLQDFRQKKLVKNQKITQKTSPEVLKRDEVLLYN